MEITAARDRDYEAGKARALRHAAKTSAEARDIGKPPSVVNPGRRAKAIGSLEFFLRTYFPRAFSLAFSTDHIDVISAIEEVTRRGGLYAIAMPRGSGKTAIVVRAALWAVLTGRRRFVSVVSSTDHAAKKIVTAMRSELTFSDLLYADFPREMHGIPQLQGDNRRAGGQLCEGEKTEIQMGKTELIFPTIKKSVCAGSIVTACGLTGNVRGQFHVTKDGTILRPDLAILDDPQTKESARSFAQTQERTEIVEGDVLGMAGPDKTIACIMPCTVIEEDDLADRVLSNPRWRGKRTKMLVSFPANMDWWENYFEVWQRSQDDAAALYVAEQETADAGAVASWPERFPPELTSAVRSAMHLWYQSPTAFAAEYQNEPQPKTPADSDLVTAEQLRSKLNRIQRGSVPTELETLTAFIDIQDHALFWAVVAWRKDLSGGVVDYGAFPDQRRDYWAYSDVRNKLGDAFPGRSSTGAIYAGLDSLVTRLARPWPRFGGGAVSMARILIDSGHETDTVYQFCRQHPQSSLLLPAKGMGITASRAPMSAWAKKATDIRRGNGWILSRTEGRGIPHVVVDVNTWKTILQQRLSAAIGDSSSLALCGDSADAHRMFADHLTSEYRTKTAGHGRELYEWKIRPDKPDNHWLDCVVGCAVAASIEGCGLPEWSALDVDDRPTFSLPGRRR